MDDIRTAKLFKQFPLFLRGRHVPINRNLMAFGFSCGPGWYCALQKAFLVAEAECQKLQRLGISQAQWPLALQVKEKFGSLRIYATNCSMNINKAIEAAEKQCAATCEHCGNACDRSGRGAVACTHCSESQEAAYQRDVASSAAKRKLVHEQGTKLLECFKAGASPLNKQQRARLIQPVVSAGYEPIHVEVVKAMLAHDPLQALREVRAVLRKVKRTKKSTYHLKKTALKLKERVQLINS